MALTTTELFEVSWSGIQTLCAFLQDNPRAKGAWLVDLTFYRQYGYSLCKGIPNEFATGILETNPNKKHTKTMSTKTPKWTCPLQQIWIGMDQGCIGIMTQVMDSLPEGLNLKETLRILCSCTRLIHLGSNRRIGTKGMNEYECRSIVK